MSQHPFHLDANIAHDELARIGKHHIASEHEAISIISVNTGDAGQHVIFSPEANHGDIADRLEAAARFVRSQPQ